MKNKTLSDYLNYLIAAVWICAILSCTFCSKAHASQNSIVLPNTGTLTGLQAVNDINAALNTVATVYSGTTVPGTPLTPQLFANTASGNLQIYDGTNWDTIGTFGSGVFSLNGTNIGTGTVPTARLATGTASSSTYLRGDQTWATIVGGGSVNGIAPSVNNYVPIWIGTSATSIGTGLPYGTSGNNTLVETNGSGAITVSTTGNAATVSTISGLVIGSTNVTITGSGTSASPYAIAASSGSGSGTVSTGSYPQLAQYVGATTVVGTSANNALTAVFNAPQSYPLSYLGTTGLGFMSYVGTSDVDTIGILGSVALGTASLGSANAESASVAIGNGALASMKGIQGYYQTGSYSHIGNGMHNVAIGEAAMYAASANGCTANVGASSFTIAIGAFAGYNEGCSTPYDNTFVGDHAGYRDTTGTANTILGGDADGAQTGSYNTLLGYQAGGISIETSANSNVMIGDFVGSTTCTTCSNNILIGTGNGVDTIASNTTGEINIGNVIYASNMPSSGTSPGGNVGIGVANPAAGTMLTITGAASNTDIQANGVTTGTGINLPSITSGTGVNVSPTTGIAFAASATTTGTGYQFTNGNAGSTTAQAILITGTQTMTANYSGSEINVTPTKTITAAATQSVSGAGNMLNINPTYSITGTLASILNMTGATANITRTVSNTSSSASSGLTLSGDVLDVINPAPTRTHTVTDSSAVLGVTQSDTSATGTVLVVTNSGTGYAALFSAGDVGIGTATPATQLDVNGDITMETGTAGAVLCLTTTHALGHCTAAASCVTTCTCTCTAN